MADATRATPPPTDPPRHASPPASPGPTPPFLLDRSDAERVREFRYRFGQAFVFGLPVVALELGGRSLGGAESDRWVSLLQALLAGWVVYVAATGMAVEGAVVLLDRRRPPAWLLADLIVACASALLYLISLLRLAPLLTGHPSANAWPSLFTPAVVLLAGWSCLRWCATKSSAGGSGRA